MQAGGQKTKKVYHYKRKEHKKAARAVQGAKRGILGGAMALRTEFALIR